MSLLNKISPTSVPLIIGILPINFCSYLVSYQISLETGKSSKGLNWPIYFELISATLFLAEETINLKLDSRFMYGLPPYFKTKEPPR